MYAGIKLERKHIDLVLVHASDLGCLDTEIKPQVKEYLEHDGEIFGFF
jgi:hypothetical protein